MNFDEEAFILLLEKASEKNKQDLKNQNAKIFLFQVILAVTYALLWLFVGFALASMLFKH